MKFYTSKTELLNITMPKLEQKNNNKVEPSNADEATNNNNNNTTNGVF